MPRNNGLLSWINIKYHESLGWWYWKPFVWSGLFWAVIIAIAVWNELIINFFRSIWQ